MERIGVGVKTGRVHMNYSGGWWTRGLGIGHRLRLVGKFGQACTRLDPQCCFRNDGPDFLSLSPGTHRDQDEGGDAWALKNGWISVTPLSLLSHVTSRPVGGLG